MCNALYKINVLSTYTSVIQPVADKNDNKDEFDDNDDDDDDDDDEDEDGEFGSCFFLMFMNRFGPGLFAIYRVSQKVALQKRF